MRIAENADFAGMECGAEMSSFNFRRLDRHLATCLPWGGHREDKSKFLCASVPLCLGVSGEVDLFQDS